jgi:hypothetical protein
MANIIPYENIQVPAHLKSRSSANDAFLAGLSVSSSFPMIGLKGTRFVVKSDGAETVLPSSEISVVLLSAKPNMDKTYYATKYDPNQTEAKSPDCFSKDGVTPDASATMKQAPSCAGCPMNQFGSGTDNQGNPNKGKACSDTKMLAIFANNGIYGFKITPASLKGFAHYIKETSRRGVDLSTAITVIGFDPNFSFPVLTFNFAGFLDPKQVAQIDQMKGSPEVADIIGGVATTASAPPVQIEEAKPVAADPFASVAVVAEPVKPRAVRVAKEKPVEVVMAEDESLDDLAASLGISL